jgi:ribosomal protein S18 acetylase RimI-like enzyme
MDASLVVKRAVQADIKKIQDDIYPFMTTKQEFDKRYIEQIGDDGFECFVAEKNGKVVHYFMVFNNALNSPLIQTPFNEKKILPSDAYLGSAFTVPEARGIWIVPHVLLSIISYFHDKKNMQRAILLVHEDTPGAAGFFKRLGFSVINNASPKNLFDAWFK